MLLNSPQEFSTQIKNGKPLISFDLGTKKIGIALSTPDHKLAMPHSIITVNNQGNIAKQCLEVITNNNCCGIVIGLPLNMNGSISTQTENAQKFANQLAQLTDLPILLQDERLTSKTADNLLKSFGLKRKERNNIDDKVAASLILETVLILISRQ